MKTCCWVLLFLGVGVISSDGKIYLNTFTHSMPLGVYWRIDGVPKRGAYAATCLPRDITIYGIAHGYLVKGSCETGSVPVLKMVAGVPGDRFMIRNGRLWMNGVSYRIRDKDSSDRLLKLFYPGKMGIIDRGKYMLMSDFVSNSWDSRYWGPVTIAFLLKPIWIEHVQK